MTHLWAGQGPCREQTIWKRPGRGRGGGVRKKVCCQIGDGRMEREEGGVTLVQRLLDGAAGGRETETP